MPLVWYLIPKTRIPSLQIQSFFESFQSPLPPAMNTRTSSESNIQNAHIQKRHPSISIICLLLFLIQSCSAESDITTIDVHKANDLLRNGHYRYLDVRTSEEFMKGHTDFDDVLNIPYMVDTPQGRVKNGKFVEQVLLLCNKDDHLIVGCKSGVRSVYATTILHDAGFKHVYNMGGGYLAWVEKGLPMTMVTTKVEL